MNRMNSCNGYGHDDSIMNTATGISVIIIVVHLTLGIQFNRFLRDALCKAGTES